MGGAVAAGLSAEELRRLIRTLSLSLSLTLSLSLSLSLTLSLSPSLTLPLMSRAGCAHAR